MRLLRTFAALLLGLPMATPIPVAAEDAPLALEVQRWVAVVVLNRTTRSLPRTGDPIWSLSLETPGQPVQHFDAVSGRAHRQNADRHRSGTRAPLPAGRYVLGPVEPLGPADPRELGPIWIRK